MHELVISNEKNEEVGRHPLKPGIVVVGRDPWCDVVLDDPRVSGQHLAIFVGEDGDVRFQDLGSKNHTYLNGKVAAHRSFQPGDVLQISETKLTLAQSDHPRPQSTSKQERKPSPRKETPSQTTITAVELQANHFEHESQDAQRLQWLREVASAICSVVDQKEVFDRILDAVFDTFDADRVIIGLASETGGAFDVQAARDLARGHDAPAEISATILDTVRAHRGPLLIEDVGADDRFRDAESVASYGVRSAMCAPVEHLDEFLGVIYVDNIRASKAFTKGDVSYLCTLAHFAAIAIHNSQAYRRLELLAENFRQELHSQCQIVAVSPQMKSVLGMAGQVAQSDCSVLILGESGTGKELIAREIHRLSPRKSEAFLAVNCAGIPETLVETELFGYVKGAFTGATSDRLGKFHQAHGGTLFLDEIADMSSATQAKVLRAIQFGEVQRVGDDNVTQVDVRVIAATNKDMTEEVTAGRFREDLFFRLNVVTISVPPLRERKADIPLVANVFLDRFRRKYGGRPTQISYEAMKKLLRHHWPGNVRELENTVERAIILGAGDVIRPSDLKLETRPFRAVATLEEMERDYIREVLEMFDWNVTKAAKILEIPRRTLTKKIRDFGWKRPG